MKTLYIVRHAKSCRNEAGLKDWERSLMCIGVERANKISDFLKKKKIQPDRIIASHAFRALNTAVIFALNLNYPVNKIEISCEFYGKEMSHVLDVIKKQSNKISSLMIFGHNPVLTELYNALTGEKLRNLSTSAVACIQFESDVWNKIHTKRGKNIFIETGK
jgi:phosphohistidine phosphatase